MSESKHVTCHNFRTHILCMYPMSALWDFNSVHANNQPYLIRFTAQFDNGLNLTQIYKV